MMEGCVQRMVGGESRKSRRPLAATKSKAPTSSLRTFSWRDSGASGKNINLKDLISFILRNVSNNVTSWGRKVTMWPPMTIASSENTADVIVEKTSRTAV